MCMGQCTKKVRPKATSDPPSCSAFNQSFLPLPNKNNKKKKSFQNQNQKKRLTNNTKHVREKQDKHIALGKQKWKKQKKKTRRPTFFLTTSLFVFYIANRLTIFSFCECQEVSPHAITTNRRSSHGEIHQSLDVRHHQHPPRLSSQMPAPRKVDNPIGP